MITELLHMWQKGGTCCVYKKKLVVGFQALLNLIM